MHNIKSKLIDYCKYAFCNNLNLKINNNTNVKMHIQKKYNT